MNRPASLWTDDSLDDFRACQTHGAFGHGTPRHDAFDSGASGYGTFEPGAPAHGNPALGPAQCGPVRCGLAGEDDALALVDAFFPSCCAHLPFGRGHDCAELAGLGQGLALSTDCFLEDRHFRRAYFTPEEAGAKALATAVSDLAAAGAAPLGFSLALLLPEDLGRKALAGILRGMAAKASEYGMILTGGDLARADKLGFSISVWGKSVTPDALFLRRTRPEPGHALFLIGECGLARVGLQVLEQFGREAVSRWPAACAAHLSPRPLLAQGQALARIAARHCTGGIGGTVSLMDVSDGLARDLPRLLGGLGAELDFDEALIPAETARAAASMGLAPDEAFLLGGEDYALLGACPQALWPEIATALPLARPLGRVSAGGGLTRKGKTLSLTGFDHFSPLAEHDPKRRLPGQAEAGAAIISHCREAWQAGLMAGFNGNVSVRAASGPDGEREACLITRSGAAKARLTSCDLALLSLPDGKLLHGPQASSESFVHLGIYAACPDSMAVMHAHPPCLLSLSLLLPPHERLDLPLPEAASYSARIAWTPYRTPGSEELGRIVAEAAALRPAIWMERHGLVVHGPDLGFCLSLTEELEQLAKVRLQSLGAYSKD